MANTGYTGVLLEAFTGRFRAVLCVGGKTHPLGRWDSVEEAVLARARAVLYFDVDSPLQCPRRSQRLGPASPEALRQLSRATWKTKRNAGSYRGVGRDRGTLTWHAAIQIGSAKHAVWGFDTEEEAAVAFDRMALYFHGSRAPRNFPERRLRPIDPEVLRRQLRKTLARRIQDRKDDGALLRKSGSFGVFFTPQSTERPWVALFSRPRRPGKQTFLGSYRTEKEAAIAHDRAALLYIGPHYKLLNFPNKAAELEPADVATLAAEAFQANKAKTTSRYRGVTWRAGAWTASISERGKTRYIGRFQDEREAALAWDRAAFRYKGRKAKLNFHRKTGEPLGGKRLDQYEAALASRRGK